MIAVIADDLTGAAELAAIAHRHGLTAEVRLEAGSSSGLEFVALDSHSRGGSAAESISRVDSVVRQLLAQRPEFIYKKVDSVLRGHVLVELETIMTMTGRSRAILVPVNPTLGRVIKAGHYLIHGQPIHETDFRHDPHYPRLSSDVLTLLGGARTLPVEICPVGGPLPERGIVVGEAQTPQDLRRWAERLDDGALAAGGAEFFAATLQHRGYSPTASGGLPPAAPTGKSLFICGSASSSTQEFVRQAAHLGVPVFSLVNESERGEMPANGQSVLLQRVLRAFNAANRVVLATGPKIPLPPGGAAELTSRLVELAAATLAAQPVARIYVEGGATARALMDHLGWRRLRVVEELALGVASLQNLAVASPILSMKPGSYLWPAELLG